MKKTIQTRRQAKAGNGFRKLHAKTTTRKRRLRAATAVADAHTDFESDVPNVGIGRALIVILVIHVVAIAVIYLHSTFIGSQPDDAAASKSEESTAEGALVAPAAEPDQASGRYIVMTGDTYARVAHAKNVDEVSLRALNDNRPLRGGVVLDLPRQLSSRPVAVHETPAQRMPQPVAAVIAEPVIPRAVVIQEDSVPRAVPVKAVAAPATVATATSDSGQRYTVKSGDSAWRIARNHKVSVDSLLKINGIKDAGKIRIGRVMVIPSN